MAEQDLVGFDDRASNDPVNESVTLQYEKLERKEMSGIRTEYEFVLPRGYLDETGALHWRGIMRMATARDELEPLRDPDPRSRHARITILVLARVIRPSVPTNWSPRTRSKGSSRRTGPISRTSTVSSTSAATDVASLPKLITP